MALRSPEREVTPTILLPEDVYAGDEDLYDPGDYGNGVRFGGLTDPAVHAADDARFFALYLDVLAGRRSWEDPELLAVASALGLVRAQSHDRRPTRAAEVVVPDEVLADATEDAAPDALYFAERITASEARPTAGVLAALAFVGCAHDGRRPLDFWVEAERDRPLARSALVIERSPPCVYEDGIPVLPLSVRLTPPPDAPAPRGVYVARAYWTTTGVGWSGVVHLPARPDPAVMCRRLSLELLRVRRHERRSTWEDMLRRRPEVVYRAAAEGARRAASGRSPAGE